MSNRAGAAPLFRGPRSKIVFLVGALLAGAAALADSTPQTLPFSQDWTDTSLISIDDEWSGVPGIDGYDAEWAGTDGVTTSNIGQCLDETPMTLEVNADRTNPNSTPASLAGIAEFEISDPVVALRGSANMDCPYLRIALDTRGKSGITIHYVARDIDEGNNDSVQPVFLLYRVGNSGPYTLVPDGSIADATLGPPTAATPHPVDAVLPADADDAALVQVVIATGNYVPPFVPFPTPTPNGGDEWVGIDDINVTGSDFGTPTPTPTITETATPTESETPGSETPTPTETPGGSETVPAPGSDSPLFAALIAVAALGLSLSLRRRA